MRTMIFVLMLAGFTHAMEYGFDSNVPLKYKKIVRQLMPQDAIEIRHVKWNTDNSKLIRFSWVDGGNITNPFGNLAEGEIDDGMECIAWVYRGWNIAISLNAAHRWNKKKTQMLDCLRIEIERIKRG